MLDHSFVNPMKFVPFVNKVRFENSNVQFGTLEWNVGRIRLSGFSPAGIESVHSEVSV